MSDPNGTILRVRGLKTHFPLRGGLLRRRGAVRAVDGVDLDVLRGQTLGLVGESGSGKTTAGRTVLGLIPATAGQICFDGQDLAGLRGKALRSARRRMQIIFQDPVSSLDPRMTVSQIISEPIVANRLLPRRRRGRRVAELLELVGLSARYVNRYPHEFSGGQRQRIGIARALASQPEFIVCDEPISALDVSIAAQILNLLSDLQDRLGLSYLFIAHNLAVVEHFADEVAVMYLGKIVERAPSLSLYARPTHPYTQALLSAVPKGDPRQRSAKLRLPGETPSPIDPPTGCAFHPRCALTRQMAQDLPMAQVHTIVGDGEPVRVVRRCAEQTPQLQSLPDTPPHCHACLLRQEYP
jgi:oligopeptide/dipeptide ABC transporter ATP-binding protein